MASEFPAIARETCPRIPWQVGTCDRTTSGLYLKTDQRVRYTGSTRLGNLHRGLAMGSASDADRSFAVEEPRGPGAFCVVGSASRRCQVQIERRSDQT